MYAGRPKPKRKEFTIVCKYCENPFVVPAYREKISKYCSRRCAFIDRRPSFDEKNRAALKALVRPKASDEVRAAKKKALGDKYRAKNRKRLRRQAKAYYEANKPKHRARQAAYEATKISATPAWADFEKMEAFYLEADRLTAETGIPHDVDHFYPLNSKIMCGLHVETNLQIITAEENRRKSNSIPETDTPCLSPKMRLRSEKPTGPQLELPLTRKQQKKKMRRKKSFLQSKAIIKPIS